jgi:hypothetical protein
MKQPNSSVRRTTFSQSEQNSSTLFSTCANLLFGVNGYMLDFPIATYVVIATDTVISLNAISSRKSSLTFASSRSLSNSM